MRKSMTLWVALMGACGPAVSVKVSGYTLEAKEELFVPMTDAAGTSVGVLLVLSDRTDSCTALTAVKAPADSNLLAVALGKRSEGKVLAPGPGSYTVGANGATVNTAAAVFFHADANGVPAIPAANAGAISGSVVVSAYSVDQQRMQGTLDAKFGQQNEAVQFQFDARLCSVSAESIRNGFIGKATGLSSDMPPPTTRGDANVAACQAYLAARPCVQMTSCEPDRSASCDASAFYQCKTRHVSCVNGQAVADNGINECAALTTGC